MTQVETTNTTEHRNNGRTYQPNVDIFETNDGLTLLADMPGTTAEKIGVEFEKGLLTITGPVEARSATDAQHLHREYGVGDYRRSFRLSENIDATKISADYTNGVLKVVLPKVEAAKPRKIAVNFSH